MKLIKAPKGSDLGMCEYMHAKNDSAPLIGAKDMKRYLPQFTIMILLCIYATGSYAATVISQVGISSNDGIGSLSGGFTNNDDISWTHIYAPISGTINSATLEVDTIDLDSPEGFWGALKHDSVLMGTLSGKNNGLPGPWRPIGHAFNDDTLFTLDAVFFSDLLGGSFSVDAHAPGDNIWGSNRALLTIDYSPVPIPAALPLFSSALGLMGFIAARKRKKQA